MGPRAVDAGTCQRCDLRPRVLPTCGPVAWAALCRDCGLEVGLEAWCDGHEDEARRLLAWADDLPAWWADAVVLWWVATGEVAWDRSSTPDVPAAVLAALPGSSVRSDGPGTPQRG